MEAWKEELRFLYRQIGSRIPDYDELYHHGILGQKWGVRRFQNPDGSLTEAGRRRLEKKDVKWAKKNYNKITNKAFKESKKELSQYADVLKRGQNSRNKDGSLSLNYVNQYNRKMAELMNSKVSDLRSPSGKLVSFVAKRGELGVHMALADSGFNMQKVKNGIYSTGKVAYKKDTVERV